MPLGEAHAGMKMVARIFAQYQPGLYELVVITQMGKITFYTHAPGFVIEIAFDGGMGIDGQRDIKYFGQQFGIVNVKVEAEVVFRFDGLFCFGR